MEPYNVLFLCTGNSCRSILAEALLNSLGHGRFQAFSAGSQPVGYVHPGALSCLARNEIEAQEPRSKSWDEFADTELDLVVTVCGNAAAETCPVWPGGPAKAHWGLPDPAHAQGTDEEIAAVFQAVFDRLHRHLERFVAAVEASPGTPLATIVESVGSPE